MKKNGFIASSILYSFFLVFVTLFVALVANYLHNRILLTKIDEEAREMLSGIKNTKISDLNVGDHIKFANKSTDYVLNPDATWTVAYIETDGDNKKYYFISDLTAQNLDIYHKLPSDKIIKYHTMSLDLYNELKNSGAYTKAMLYDGFDISLPTSSFLTKIRNSDINNDIKKTIFNAGGNYVVYVDSVISGFDSNNNTVSYEQGAYYELRAYNFSLGSQQSNVLSNYCGGTFNGTDAVYNTSNTFGYINVVKESAKNEKYVDFCYYASPVSYTHNSNEFVVPITETRENDKLVASNTSAYNYRLVAELTVDVNSTETYVSGGRGTILDPYLFSNGVKQS